MTVIVTVDLHQAEIRNFLYSPAGPIVRGVKRWSNEVRGVAVGQAPKDTGRLASSSSVAMNTYPGFVVGEISFGARHALWVHEGTGIYGSRHRPIRARSGGKLKFPSGAGYRAFTKGRRFTYTRMVRGQPGNPFLVSALTWVMLPKGARIKRFRVR
jgi:hypothetical protein